MQLEGPEQARKVAHVTIVKFIQQDQVQGPASGSELSSTSTETGTEGIESSSEERNLVKGKLGVSQEWALAAIIKKPCMTLSGSFT